ncbi:DUF4330 family protein [Halobaculum sp. MBLA0147]|uniref:DUF4330 family protein n=1 Tax=Halobaculum sp. MBLA0147 TaxID=3079934 RepID=UPI0035248F70
MELIDEDGNLFGRVNVVDALVVLAVLVAAAAGAALVGSGDESDPTLGAVNATLDLGVQPQFVVEAIEDGDVYSPTGTAELRITDVYTTPTSRGTRVVTRVSLTGERAGDTIRYDGVPPRLGRTLDVITGEYEVSGEIRALGGGRQLTTSSTTVLVRDVLSVKKATEIDQGDRIVVAGRRVAVVENVTIQPTTTPTNRLVYATLNLSTLARNGVDRFGGRQIRPGQTFRLAAPDFTLDGRIEAINQNPRVGTESVVLRTTLPAKRARQIAPGDTVTVADETIATVDTHRVYLTDEPDRRVVFLSVNLTAVRRAGTLRFGSTPIQRGQQLTLDTGEYTITGTIDDIGGGLAAGRTKVLVTDTVDPETADRLSVGDSVRVGNDVTATVTNVSAYGTSNPDRKRIAVGLSLRTVSYGEAPRFRNKFVKEGNELAIRTDAYEFTGKIERVGTTNRRGTPATRTATLRLNEVRADIAQSIQSGMVERTGGEVLARLTDVQRTPSTILIRGDDGELGVFDHPTLRDVRMNVSLEVQETVDGVRFKGEPVRQGELITLDLGTITIEATVVSIGG